MKIKHLIDKYHAHEWFLKENKNKVIVLDSYLKCKIKEII